MEPARPDSPRAGAPGGPYHPLYTAGEADFVYLQREGGFTQGNLSGHLLKLEAAGYVQIQKKFKGKFPLTLCRLTPKGQRALENYSKQMLAFFTLKK